MLFRLFSTKNQFLSFDYQAENKKQKKRKNLLTNYYIVAIILKLCDAVLIFGGIAQLGERLNGIQEVSGSIPLISTTKSSENFGFQNFFFVFNKKKF